MVSFLNCKAKLTDAFGKDNYRAVDEKTKVHMLVRKHLDGRYRACVAAKDSTRFPLLQDFGEMSLTVVDALKALLDRSCEWLYEAEARDAESERHFAAQVVVHAREEEYLREVYIRRQHLRL